MKKTVILVVDDDKDVADEIASSIVDSNKYNVLIAYSAKEALETIKKNRRRLSEERNNIGCIILDIKMPEMDGLEFLKKVRKEYHEDEMGVIMLTAYEDADKWEKATDGFVASYLKKPFKQEELMSTLDRFFSDKDERIKMVVDTFEKHIDKMDELKEQQKEEK